MPIFQPSMANNCRLSRARGWRGRRESASPLLPHHTHHPTVVDIPLVTQRQILMVQSVWRTIVTSQLQYASDRRCPCCACRAAFWWCPDVQRTVVSTVAVTVSSFTCPLLCTISSRLFRAVQCSLRGDSRDPTVARSCRSCSTLTRWSMSRLWFTCLSFFNDRCRDGCCVFFRAVCTGTRPGLTPAIRAGKGWRGHRELAPRCFATQLAARRHDPGQTRRVLNYPNHTHHHHHLRSHVGSNRVADTA